MSQGDVEARVVADTSGLQAGMVQAAVVTEAQMKKIAQYVRAANDQTANLGKAAQSAAASTSTAYKQIAEGAEKVRAGHAGVNRELLVLTHELSQGNYKRFGGSLLVLAEQTNFLSFAMTGAGAAVSLLGGLVLGAGALMAMGAIDADKFAKSLQLTGNFAATTSEQIGMLAEAQAKQTGQSVGKARDSLEAVAGSGVFGQSELAAASRALGDYQRMTGTAADEAIKKFQSIQDGVAKWAAEENKSVHFITAAEYEHIKALEDSGNKQQAAIEALTAYAGAIETRGEPAVGLLARAWHAVADGASRAGQAIMDIGRPTDSLVAGLAAVDRQIQLVKQANTGNPAAAADVLQQLATERQRLEQLAFRGNERRSDSATNAALQQAAIESDKYVESVLKGAKALSQRTDELKKWDAAVAAKAAAGSPMSAADISAGRAEIMKRFADHGGEAQANEYKSLLATLETFNRITDEQIQKQGKLSDVDMFVIRTNEELEKSGRKLNEQQRQSIRLITDASAAYRQQAEIKAKVHELNTTQQDFRTSEIQGTDSTNKAMRDAQLAEEAIRHTKVVQDAFNESAGNGYTKASQEFIRQANNNAQHAEEFFNSAIGGMTDALANFAETGKLNWKSLIDSMIQQLIRLELQKGFATVLGGGVGNGSSPALSGLFAAFGSGTGSGSDSASLANLFSSDYGGAAFANGIDYVPYDGMPAILHEGEKVVRRQDAAVERNGGGKPLVQIHMGGISVGAGVNAAEVAQAVKTGMAQTKAEISRSLKTGGSA